MFWSKSPPTSLPDYRCSKVVGSIKREELNSRNLGIIGDRTSGKSTFLAKTIIHKSDQENALVLCTYATERYFWSNIIEKYNITRTVVHTPDSLARYLLSLWAKKEGKKIEWVLDREVVGEASKKSSQAWRDEKGYALWLIKSNKMTAGIAHWLLSNEIENFIENKMLPNLDLFCIDQPEEWEPEAEKWVKCLPRTRTIMTTRSKENLWTECEQLRYLPGVYDWQGQHSNYQYLKVIEGIPKIVKRNTCIICQKESKMKLLREINKGSKSEIRKIEQIRGRRYNEIYIESLPTCSDSIECWGNRSQALDYLDLISSRGRTMGIAKSEDDLSYLPPRKQNERFLIWKTPNKEDKEHNNQKQKTE